MLGYYRVENPGVIEVPPEGWHDTGDIVTIDAQGFIAIKGRAKRFAKIAGEMVSLSAVEALSAELWPQLITVVVSMPDARKGERLVLLTTDATCTREAFSQFARRKGATELMVPTEILVVDKIPLWDLAKPITSPPQRSPRSAPQPKAPLEYLFFLGGEGGPQDDRKGGVSQPPASTARMRVMSSSIWCTSSWAEPNLRSGLIKSTNSTSMSCP